MGDTVITPETHLLVIQTWVKMWPPAVVTRYKVFAINKDVKSIKKFLQIFTNYLQDARKAKSIAELALWSVTPNSNTKWDGTKPGKPDTYADVTKSGNHDKGNPGRNKRQLESSSSSSSRAVTTSSGTTDLNATCNVCFRLKHEGNKCPFYSWHPFANKDSKIPFPESDKGKAFTTQHSLHHKYFDDKDLDGVTVYANRPANFKLPPSRLSTNDGADHSKGSGKSKGIVDDLVPFSFHESTFLNANLMRSLDSLINCSISLTQVVGTKRSIRNKDQDIHVEALLDSDSLAGNFISVSTLSNLGVIQNLSVDGLRLPICSGLDNVCTNISNIVYKLSISLVNENYKYSDFIPRYFLILRMLRFCLTPPLI
jgi:hypothetical protein